MTFIGEMLTFFRETPKKSREKISGKIWPSVSEVLDPLVIMPIVLRWSVARVQLGLWLRHCAYSSMIWAINHSLWLQRLIIPQRSTVCICTYDCFEADSAVFVSAELISCY